MARKKLTLTVDEEAIRKARRYSDLHGTSVSELVTRYLASLDEEHPANTRIVSRLRGILPEDASVEDYRDRIVEKYDR